MRIVRVGAAAVFIAGAAWTASAGHYIDAAVLAVFALLQGWAAVRTP